MGKKKVESEEQPEQSFVVESDTANEAVLVAAALVDPTSADRLLRKLRPECFFHEEHRAAWQVFADLRRKGLSLDLATVQRAASGRVNVDYLSKLVEVRPEPPDNLDFHLDAALWDHTRLTAVRGPISSLLEAVRDPKQEPARVRALARQVAGSFEGTGGNHVCDSRRLVADQLRDLDRRVGGHACWPYGIDGLDRYPDGESDLKGNDLGGKLRMVPGAAPGQITVLTALSGSGKSTFASHIVLGLARQRRRVLYAAWEPDAGMMLELYAGISLGWSRTDLIQGIGITPERRVQLEERMHKVTRWVRFMENPFRRRRGEKASNAKNLDVVQQNIADSGADVFIADLWERCLHDSDPGEEKEALYRQQAMASEMRVHCVLLAQQRLKDLEQRPDRRPTREGIKGSGAWVEVADTILGIHLPALWKDVPDDKLEVFVLKQRWGKWPLGVEFQWDPDCGSIEGGASIRYDRPGEISETNPIDIGFRKSAGGSRYKR